MPVIIDLASDASGFTQNRTTREGAPILSLLDEDVSPLLNEDGNPATWSPSITEIKPSLITELTDLSAVTTSIGGADVSLFEGGNLAERLNAILAKKGSSISYAQYKDLFVPTDNNKTWVQFDTRYMGASIMPPKDNFDMIEFEVNATRQTADYSIMTFSNQFTKSMNTKIDGTGRFYANTAYWEIIKKTMLNNIGITLDAYFFTFDPGAPMRGYFVGVIRGLDLNNFTLLRIGTGNDFQNNNISFNAVDFETYVMPGIY